MESVTLLVVAIALAVAGIAAWALLAAERGRRRSDDRLVQLAETAASLSAAQASLEGRLKQMSEVTAAERAEMQRTLQDRLDGMSKRLGESLEQTATKTASSLGELTKHLNVIDQAQKNISDLAGQVITLQEILDNKQARGAFGEVQLQDLVAGILPPSAYAFQAVLGNGRRVDCLVRLPQPPGPICIDSKFPLESYHALRAAGSEVEAKQAQRDFRAAIQKHVADIRERYILPGETADSALLFLPSEAVYAELHANFPDAVEQSYRARVWIVSPTTLMATLNTVRAVLKDARMREQAGVIQAEVLKLLDDVQRLDKRVDSLRRHFGQMEGDVKEIGVSTDKIVRRAGRIEEVQIEAGEAGEATADALAPQPPGGAPGPLPRLGTGSGQGN
ncbi:MAG TPA: DNA recombination protein RmuC [Alphaproteobacteria bacterium]|nr:DNA recombination protein RmuC [Alphaproteobacteria bacterium]